MLQTYRTFAEIISLPQKQLIFGEDHISKFRDDYTVDLCEDMETDIRKEKVLKVSELINDDGDYLQLWFYCGVEFMLVKECRGGHQGIHRWVFDMALYDAAYLYLIQLSRKYADDTPFVNYVSLADKIDVNEVQNFRGKVINVCGAPVPEYKTGVFANNVNELKNNPYLDQYRHQDEDHYLLVTSTETGDLSEYILHKNTTFMQRVTILDRVSMLTQYPNLYFRGTIYQFLIYKTVNAPVGEFECTKF